ncbi:hypothetical protein DGMP_18760 [Desulfomarina profundi]|uniref:PilZ domain-containing protein n=1 Tax=Desulfomarina profundi TaxID=2772557 RepID=A0A8D5FH13_9BACT|nr:hypothetical protein [Desulfomarina profundi]BCL61183.1 hypothetical protein DGMP_18760 [Desulfomarina profundi]
MGNIIGDCFERRERMRLHYSAAVEITVKSGDVIKGNLRDIAIESIYFSSDSSVLKTLEPGDDVDVDISVEVSGSCLIIRSSGYVARREEGGVAIRFVSPLKWWPVFCFFPSNESFLPAATFTECV